MLRYDIDLERPPDVGAHALRELRRLDAPEQMTLLRRMATAAVGEQVRPGDLRFPAQSDGQAPHAHDRR